MQTTLKVLIPVLLALGCTSCQAGESPPTIDELANATYTGIYDEEVTLEQGRYEGEPFVDGGSARPSVGLVKDFILYADLDSDGGEEALVELWESSGGSGTNNYIAVMSRKENGIVNLATAWIGNRVQVRGGRIIDGLIEVDVLQHGEEDAMCCPTQLATRTWSLVGQGLEEGRETVTGILANEAKAD